MALDDDSLADELRRLRQQIASLQADLQPAVQSSLRERSDELQRLSGQLAEREAEAARLRVRQQELEAEVERWREAARRGVEEVAEKARQAAERYERQTQELIATLAQVRAQLDASREQARAALLEVEKVNGRNRALKAKVLRREVERLEMMNSLPGRIAGFSAWLPKATHRTLVQIARMRRRILKR